MVTGLDPNEIIDGLERAGFAVLALTPGGETSLDRMPRGGRVALMLGPEGPGLPAGVIARCRPVGIPMSGGFDSLNVSVASVESPCIISPGRRETITELRLTLRIP